jgi:pilus assembly protein CpaE
VESEDRIRVLVIEDSAPVIKHYRKLLQLIENVEILDIIEDAQGAIAIIRDEKPDVILAELNMPGMDGIKLTETVKRDYPTSQVIILSEDKYYTSVLKAMRTGASDFLTHDANLDELNAAVKRAGEQAQIDKKKFRPFGIMDKAQETSTKPKETGEPGGIVTVYSTKGGTGVSTITANLGLALYDSESRVVLVDGCLQYGDIAILFNELGKLSAIDLAPRIHDLDSKLLEDVMIFHKNSGLMILPAPQRPELSENITGEQFAHILEFMRPTFSYIVVNTTSFLTEPTLAALDCGDVMELIVTQEVSAIRSTRAFLELWDGFGLSRDRINLVINRYNKNNPITSEKIGDTLKQQVCLTIPADEESANRASNLGIPLLLSDKKSEVAFAIRSLAEMTKKKFPTADVNGRFRLFPKS